ncbi:hypothetical protein HK102_011252 [Quaeritorhiza haematococci]|nr:hypothetical protein HK102_011252 [Quaeritorhiza haematococci]
MAPQTAQAAVAAPVTNENPYLYLTFSPKCPPYAEVAAYLLALNQQQPSSPSKSNSKGTASSKTNDILKLGLDLDLASSQANLIIPPGARASTRTVLTGKSSIARYFTRAFPAPAGSTLYEGLVAAARIEVDDWIDAVRTASTPESVTKVVEKIQQKQKEKKDKKVPAFLTSAGKLCLADIFAWDFVRTKVLASASSPSPLADWVAKLEESTPELKKAVLKVDAKIASAPVVDVFRAQIVAQVSAITGADPANVYSLIEVPKDPKNGDISIPMPRLRVPGNPAQLAAKIAQEFKPNEYITKATSVGPFLNFFIARDLLRDKVIPQVLTLDSTYGHNATGFGKTAIVEFSSPNIAKPFHAGHLRSTIIGNFIKMVLDSCGWKTLTINYLGDWGKQFGLLAVGYAKYGSREELEKDPIRHLFDVYVKINRDKEANPEIDDEARAHFKKMEDGDPEAVAQWQEFRSLSIEKYKEIYGRLNVSFDVYSGESQYNLRQVQPILEELKDFGLLTPSEGAEVVDLKEHNLGVAIITKKDGSLLYLSRDIAAASQRQVMYHFDHMYYVVGSQQDHHFKQLFKILELMGKHWARQCNHINFGMIKSKDGNMSTRKGTVVFLQDILDQTKEEMHNVMKGNPDKYAQIPDPEKVSDLVGISSIMIQDMSARRNKDYEFDWNRMLSFEGDTGPYLQYAHARLRSIERTAAESLGISIPVGPGSDDPAATQSLAALVDRLDLTLLKEPQAHALIDIIAQYPFVVRDVSKNLEPCTIVQYLFELSHRVSAALEALWVMGQEKPVAEARLAMYMSARITLGNALRMLGLR